MLLRWLILLLFLNLKALAILKRKPSIFKRNAKLKQNIENDQTLNDIYDTNRIKIPRQRSTEKTYNKKFHYYTIKTLFEVSLILGTISLALNLIYFWKQFTTSLVYDKESNKILSENIKYFETKKIFDNFNQTINKLKSRKILDLSLVEKPDKKLEDDEDLYKKENVTSLLNSPVPSQHEILNDSTENIIESESITSLTFESEQTCEPKVHIFNDDSKFNSNLKASLNKTSSSQSINNQYIFRTELVSNVNEPSICNINISSSDSSFNMNYRNVAHRTGKIEFLVRN